MLIEAVLGLFLTLFRLFLLPVQIEGFPDQVKSVLLDVILLLIRGCEVLAVYTHFSYILVLLGIVVSVSAAINVYRVVMWILKKIPFLNIK